MNSDNKLNTINEFYSNEISLGPYEVPGGKFKYYAMGTLSYHFINSLINNNHPIISNNVFLPKCKGNENPNASNVSNVSNVSNASNISNIIKTKNIVIFNPPEYTKNYKKLHKTNSFYLIIPNYIYKMFIKLGTSDKCDTSNNCGKNGTNVTSNNYGKQVTSNNCGTSNKNITNSNKLFKKFIFLNLFLISTDDNNNITFQHGNILILDTFNKTIERFDPHGGSTFIDLNSKKRIKNLKRIYKQELIDEILRNKFTNILPNYKYLDLSITCPYIGPQLKVDMYKGLCMTWCLMYFLLRIYNPNVSMSDINKYLIINDYKTILYNILHFQKYVIDYLRNQ